MKSSRRSFLKGLGAIFALPLAGLKPKSVDEELPGIVKGLPESSEQPLTEEEQKFSDSPYRMADGGGSMRTTFLSPDGKGGYIATRYEDWVDTEEE